MNTILILLRSLMVYNTVPGFKRNHVLCCPLVPWCSYSSLPQPFHHCILVRTACQRSLGVLAPFFKNKASPATLQFLHQFSLWASFRQKTAPHQCHAQCTSTLSHLIVRTWQVPLPSSPILSPCLLQISVTFHVLHLSMNLERTSTWVLTIHSCNISTVQIYLYTISSTATISSNKLNTVLQAHLIVFNILQSRCLLV